jgi:osmotically-inducible protein OsmY
MKTSDDEIAKRAVNILGWDSMVPRDSIQVMVRDGWVTLTWSVDWHYHAAWSAPDVKSVEDRI